MGHWLGRSVSHLSVMVERRPLPLRSAAGIGPWGLGRNASVSRCQSGGSVRPAREPVRNVTRIPPDRRGNCARLASMFLFVRVCGLAAIVLCSAGPLKAQAPLPELMTDTPEYCTELQDRLGVLIAGSVLPPPHEVADLSTQGQTLCAHGHVRGGVQRLRRALVIMQQHGEAP